MRLAIQLIACCFALLFFISASASADVLLLKTGERLSGSWVNVAQGNVNFKSDALGAVSIPLDQVQSLTTSQEAVIIRKDHSTARGVLRLLPSRDWQITEAGKVQVVPALTVDTIITASEYNSLMNHHAELWQDWHGAANAGYNLQRGDQQTGTISASVAATRERPEPPVFMRHFRTNYSLQMLFAKAQQGSSVIHSNTITTLLREDYLFEPNDFAFVSGELDHVQAQGLYLRQTYGGGLGRDLIHSKRTLFSVIGGLTFVNEKLYTGGPARQSIEALAGEKLAVKLGKRMELAHYLDFYPDLTHLGEYHFDTSSSIAFSISKRLAANVSLVDNYLSNPAPGNHKNNVALTAGIGVTF
ncbi:MAG: DUF481 domain-containing protein [Terriglobia bacterium]